MLGTFLCPEKCNNDDFAAALPVLVRPKCQDDAAFNGDISKATIDVRNGAVCGACGAGMNEETLATKEALLESLIKKASLTRYNHHLITFVRYLCALSNCFKKCYKYYGNYF